MQQRAQAQETDEEEYQAPPVDIATKRARQDLARLSAFVNAELAAGRRAPWDTRDLYGRFQTANPGSPDPVDPFDGTRYGYDQRASEYFIWSVGPDSRVVDGGRPDLRLARARIATLTASRAQRVNSIPLSNTSTGTP